MNNPRRTMAFGIALLCAITLLACDLGGGASGGQQQQPSGTQPPPPSRTQPPPPSGGQAPAAPSGLRVTSTTKTTARIAWDDKANNEDGFEIESPGKQYPKTAPNETQSEITGLECGKAYNFKVRAFNAAGNSAYSNEVTAQTLACDGGGQQPTVGGGQSGGQVPTAPANLRVTSTTTTGVQITFDDKSNNEDGFEIEIGGMENFKTVPNMWQLNINGLACGKAYNFRVRAFNAAGNSPWSNQVTAQTLACDSGGQQPPFQVTGITLRVSFSSYTGACPPVDPVRFSGVITMNGPGTVTYGWEGAEGPSAGHNNFIWGIGYTPATGYHNITFTAAGSQTVTLDYPITIKTTGWYEASLVTSAPNEKSSPVVGLMVTCQ